MRRGLAAVWGGWKALARCLGTLQARVLLTLFYFVVLAPFALGLKLGTDPLRLRARAPGGWLPRVGGTGDPAARAGRQS